MIFKKLSAAPRTVERFARRPLPSRSGFPDRFVSGFDAMGRLFAVKVHAAGESPFGLSSARQIFRRHAPRDGQSARCGDAIHSVTVTESEAEPAAAAATVTEDAAQARLQALPVSSVSGKFQKVFVKHF